MKKRVGFFAFISIQIMLVVCHIHQQSLFVRELYREQRLCTTKKELEHEKELLIKTLCAYKRPEEVKQFALQSLAMSPLSLSQIKTVTLL